MLKVKRINLSGFRGILNPQELNFIDGGKEPRSLVLFGLNSSGKTSFVDGLEWFLSEENKIEWLRRDEAKEKAYPHQAAKDKSIASYVQMEFFDAGKEIDELTKTYDHNKITEPVLSDKDGFKNIYSSFIIRPYFRYLEVVDFVCSKGKEKYERLAQWMGFQNEFDFQEGIARGVQQTIKSYEKTLSDRVDNFESQLKQLINSPTALDGEVLNFCNAILKHHKVSECKDVKEVWGRIPEISKKKIASAVGVAIDKLSRIETSITASVLKSDLLDELEKLSKKISDFRKDKKLIAQVDVMGLYTQVLDVLTRQDAESTKCPVCGTEWQRDKLMEHIKSELELLKKTKDEKELLEREITSFKTAISGEINSVSGLINRYKEAQESIPEIKHENTTAYLESLNKMSVDLSRVLSNSSVQVTLGKDATTSVVSEKSAILEQIKNHKTKIQPSAEDVKLSEDIEKLTQIKTSWQSLEDARSEQHFTAQEILKFYALRDSVLKEIQDNIKARFEEISERIGKYFGILRDDKDIKDIKIVLNERGRASDRSAEIELNYYDISVRPAYKVLSESLLNSLGLAVYFTCVKQFNEKCKFIVLDDIMNSLDIDKRDTLLDLIEKEFADYQIIIFTHDLYWFQKIIRRFPDWIHKKIKGWDYIGGAKIDSVTTTKNEIDECLADSMRIEEGGWKLGRHAESILNELCEGLWAAVRYRYAKNDPPTMEELFDALYIRLKAYPVAQKVLNTKKYEPILRNFVTHARNNQPAALSPQDIKRASDEWFSLEAEFLCDGCNHFVEYHKSKDKFECRCGKKKFEVVKDSK